LGCGGVSPAICNRWRAEKMAPRAGKTLEADRRLIHVAVDTFHFAAHQVDLMPETGAA
jgi:hypothetical protein